MTTMLNDYYIVQFEKPPQPLPGKLIHLDDKTNTTIRKGTVVNAPKDSPLIGDTVFIIQRYGLDYGVDDHVMVKYEHILARENS